MYNDRPHAARYYLGAGCSSHGSSQGYDPRRGRARYLDYGAMPITACILPAPEAGSSLLSGHSAHSALDPREAKRERLDAGIDPYHVREGTEGLQPGQGAFFVTLIFSESFSITYGLFFPDL
uniref:Uncharacterized protein n=1 Tax=Aegilops tauschii subsp. strangulata TaxID=200361 RepID=A0A453LBP8_AEGTS